MPRRSDKSVTNLILVWTAPLIHGERTPSQEVQLRCGGQSKNMAFAWCSKGGTQDLAGYVLI